MKIVITGSSSGIGFDLTQRFLAQDHEIWGLARSTQSLNHERFHSSVCDVLDWKSVESAAHTVALKGSSLDGLICCTGTQGAVGQTMDLDPQTWSNTVRSNLDGVFYSIRAFYPLLRQSQRRAKVICFSGGGATSPRPFFSAYGVAKAALVRLVETLAVEWKDLPIDINAVAPGAIRTRLTEEVIQMGPEKVGLNEYTQAKKVMETGGGSLNKVYDLIRFLLSEQSNGISGKLIAAQWDPWEKIPENRVSFMSSDTYTLRRVVPKEWT